MIMSLHHLTVADAPVEELIDIAAATGSDRICVFARMPQPLLPSLPIVESVAHAAALRDRAQLAGISFQTIDTLSIGHTEPGEHEETLAIGQALGARAVNCVYREGDAGTAVRKFSAFAQLADRYGLSVIYEWSRFNRISTLAGAADFLRRVDAPNIGLNADVLHLIRNGEGPEDLLGVDPAWLIYAQLCDGPLILPEEDMREEAVHNRGFPGEGEFPLTAFVRNLPAHTVIGVEAPAERLRPILSPLERARRAVDGARRVLAAAGR